MWAFSIVLGLLGILAGKTPDFNKVVSFCYRTLVFRRDSRVCRGPLLIISLLRLPSQFEEGPVKSQP